MPYVLLESDVAGAGSAKKVVGRWGAVAGERGGEGERVYNIARLPRRLSG